MDVRRCRRAHQTAPGVAFDLRQARPGRGRLGTAYFGIDGWMGLFGAEGGPNQGCDGPNLFRLARSGTRRTAAARRRRPLTVCLPELTSPLLGPTECSPTL